MIGNAAAAARLAGQNVRGPSQLKLEKLVQLMEESRCFGRVASVEFGVHTCLGVLEGNLIFLRPLVNVVCYQGINLPLDGEGAVQPLKRFTWVGTQGEACRTYFLGLSLRLRLRDHRCLNSSGIVSLNDFEVTDVCRSDDCQARKETFHIFHNTSDDCAGCQLLTCPCDASLNKPRSPMFEPSECHTGDFHRAGKFYVFVDMRVPILRYYCPSRWIETAAIVPAPFPLTSAHG